MAVLDREIRRAGVAGFNSFMVLRLADRPDVDALRAAVAADSEFGRWLRAPVRRTFPFRRFYRDATSAGAAPRVDLLDAAPSGETSPWPSLLNAALDPSRGENVRFTVFPVPHDGWRVAFLFSHLLTDAKAAERLVVQLSTGGGAASWPDPRSLLGDTRFPAVAREAREHARSIVREAGGSVHAVCGRVENVTRAGACVGAAVTLDSAETAAAVSAGRKAAGYAMEGLWYLACALAADRDLERSPPAQGARYVVPLPTSLDKKGETRAFGNNLVFLFLGAPVEEAGDPAALARRFRGRLLLHLKDRDDRGSQAQMEFTRRLPLAMQSSLARRAVGGGLGSLFFTNPGPVDPGLSRFFGADVLDVGHFPIPTPEPGICAIVWTFGDRLHLGLTWLRGRIDDDRGHAMLARWRVRIGEVRA